MCQAYEGEYRLMCSLEDFACEEGFFAALQGQPCFCQGSLCKEKFEHGYRCFQQGILPWAIERKFRQFESIDYQAIERMKKVFSEARDFAKALTCIPEDRTPHAYNTYRTANA
jgi:hypothetical protein